jgi:hypothetical protein
MRTAVPLSILALATSLAFPTPATAAQAPGAPAPGRPASLTTPSARFRFWVRPRTARPGQPVTLAGSGCAPGARVGFAWVRAGVVPASVGNLPPATARRDGTFQATWRLDPGFRPGRIAITAGCAQPGALATAILTISQQPQANGLRITQPANQSGVTQGTTVVVRGLGCPAGATVQVRFNARLLATATARADGSFRAPVRIPTYRIDPTMPESQEAELTATCGQQRDAVVVVVNPAHHVRVVPSGGVATGGGGTAAGAPGWPLGLGVLLLVAAGLAVARRTRRQRA